MADIWHGIVFFFLFYKFCFDKLSPFWYNLALDCRLQIMREVNA